ncbi:hypothetical protein [Botrimarina mediterranea]|uniref:hypothetical protein n=1 Tax=Botrimarina mediterranea TaxID=2528022 RepID=UPI0018D2CE86|nr:hypothetical protein [Botrimarina mediterranea]
MSSDDGRPPYVEALAAKLVGSHVLVGITKLDHLGNLIEQIQYHGVVIAADANRGFQIELSGIRSGEFEWLPPDTRNFFEAKPGEYHLRSTGETVVDPKFLSTWTSRKHNPE